ncbi:bifunctional metallophosphatase/5'-nucleotidase [Haloglomus litoreum]|uniref:bifunctional metallophosphatase/5'-nucleotidase n=1 Tax=Haloglomus litoreum TaxID=3034026 RepID=UPI0023E7BE1B|nr:bifunctional metallophosphatase/5'-nucleotidase [Haloglomus sp. DT116]
MPLALHYSDLETALDRPDQLARLVGLVESLRDDRTLVVGTGDDTAPGALPLVTDGRAVLDAVDALAPDADVPGNHDFDAGVAAARDVLAATPQPYLAANLYDGTERAPAVEPWVVRETADARVGLVGVAHPETGKMNPEAADLRFEPVRPAVDEAVAAVRERGVDHVVVLAHLGRGSNGGSGGVPGGRDLAQDLDVAAVLDGHAHKHVATVVDGTVYARGGQGASHLNLVDLAARSVEPRRVGPDAPLHEGTATSLRERAREAGLTDVVATLDRPVRCDRPAVRAGESRIGNLVADAYRRRAEADVALVAPAAIRAGPDLSGAVTAWDLCRLVPFRDELVSLAVDGATLRRALARATGDPYPAWADWYFGHYAGVRLRYDEAAAEVLSVDVGGAPLADRRTYRLATTDYYVRSDHLFPDLTPDLVVDRHGPQYEAVLGALRDGLGVPELSGRVDRVGFEGVPDDAY